MVFLLAILTIGPLRPDPRLTPGVVRQDLTKTEICATKWGRDHRAVTDSMRQEVMRRYGLPWSKHHLYEIDHLIPRDLGGADDVRNLWPQLLWDAKHVKDPLEVRLNNQVCAGELSLKTAQEQMRTWAP